MSLKFYDENAKDYFDKSVNLDVRYMYPFFLNYLSEKSKILDLGCGSGRDSKAFLDMGYDVTSVDGSSELAKLASDYIGKEVIVSDFRDIKYENEFDGIWAMSSLLHLPKIDTLEVYKNLAHSLKSNGTMYVCYKVGETEREERGRFFNDYTEESFKEFISTVEDFKIKEVLLTGSTMNNHDKILNLILKKQ